MTPLFSIGVTTYDRWALLRETLVSISRQTFGDFEVLVGNDHVAQPLSADDLGVDDPRLRIVNHPRNLGETGNMNALLALASGRYFTWLADDDLHAPRFLEATRTALETFGAQCAFASYAFGAAFPEEAVAATPPIRMLTGREFLREYLARSLKALGCYGVFETSILRALGGMERLGQGFSPYSDNLLAIRCGLLDRIAYVDAPLVLFRAHPGSVSLTSRDVAAYTTAQEALVERALPVLTAESLRADFARNLFMLLRWCIRDFAAVVARAGGLGGGAAVRYLRFVAAAARPLRGSGLYAPTLRFAARTGARVAVDMVRSVGRGAAPA
jgi:glycosyltransferase involved in cell wall biosynthesis